MKDPVFSEVVSDKISGDDDEEELAQHGKGLVTGIIPEDKEKPVWLDTYKKIYCVNCRNMIHNTPENDSRCKGKQCECRCRTHYIGRDGLARPYGTPDDSKEREEKRRPKTTPQSDEAFQKLMEEHRQGKNNEAKP